MEDCTIDELAFADTVRLFNKTFKATPDFELRKKLIEEELAEWIEAHEAGDTEKEQREWSDLLFVVLGAGDAMKYDTAAAMNQVGGKNWRKIQNADQMIVREDGKIVKPPGDERFV